MQFKKVVILSFFAVLAGTTPTGSTGNAAASPDPSSLAKIEKNAGGTLPNGPLPASIGTDGLTNLKLIAFNELFEVAYFTDLLYNITNQVTGYTSFGNFTYDFVYNAILAVRAQEKLHLFNANEALAHYGEAPIKRCEYTYPVTSFTGAIILAASFTNVNLGSLQDVQTFFAQDGGAEASSLVPFIGSVIGQEGEQGGFYRILQGRKPSAAPFLTRSTRDFAFSALQRFVVPGSCPNIGTIPLKIFGKLSVLSTPVAANSTLNFSVAGSVNKVKNSIAYISGQNLPVSVALQNVSMSNGVTTFSADFPFGSGFSDGLTLAALVKGQGPFDTAEAVAASTLFGPGVLEVD